MIWLIGANGMLGRDLLEALDAAKVHYVATGSEVDITDIEALRTFVGGKSIDWVINAAAYTAVDRAEEEQEKAMAINGDGPGHIGTVARELGAKVLHFSTDYVFDGQKDGAYTEADSPCPDSAYGRSKLAGEEALLQACPQAIIVRISWLYGVHGGNFVSTMLRLFGERDALGIVNDQQGSPTWTRPLAQKVVRYIGSSLAKEPEFGVYHYSDDGMATWYAFACAIRDEAKKLGLLKGDVKLNPIKTEDYPTPAKRPANSLLDKTKIKQKLDFELDPWRGNLRQFLTELH